jgi:hypothetical protein
MIDLATFHTSKDLIMINNTEIYRTLVAAKELFDRRGGAIGAALDSDNRVCASNALRLTIKNDIDERLDAEQRALYRTCGYVLNNSSVELYNTQDIIVVNDDIGYDAARAVYDHAIKTIKGAAVDDRTGNAEGC